MRLRYVITAFAIAFFSLPIALRAVGYTAKPFENKALAPAPKLSQGWDVFPETTQFFTDRMPGREQAIKANRDIYKTVFHTIPNYSDDPTASPIVVHGSGGWLFSGARMDATCTRDKYMSVAAASKDWLDLQQAVEAQGKKLIIVVVPDKDTVYPEKLPARFASRDCLSGAEARFWNQIYKVHTPGFLPMRNTMLRAKRKETLPIYYRDDSHWTRLGGTYLISDVLDSLGGRTRLRRSDLQLGEYSHYGDIATADQTPRPETQITALQAVRPPNAPKVPGKTVAILDSFGLNIQDLLAPYFEDLQVIEFDGFSYDGKGRGQSAAFRANAIAGADTVIVETAERFYITRAPVAKELADAVRARAAKTATDSKGP